MKFRGGAHTSTGLSTGGPLRSREVASSGQVGHRGHLRIRRSPRGLVPECPCLSTCFCCLPTGACRFGLRSRWSWGGQSAQVLADTRIPPDRRDDSVRRRLRLSLWLKWLRKLDPLQLAIVKPLSRAWYRLHVYLAIAGTVLGIAGVVWGHLIVDWAHNGVHLRLPHSYVGFATGAVLVAPLLIGFVTRASGKRKQSVRWWHVVIGVLGMAFMQAGAFTG